MNDGMVWNYTLNFWDYLLLVVVSLQATVLAYLHAPRWKAFMLILPFPFTVAVLAVQRPVDATNVAGLLVLLVYTHAVRVLHRRLRLPIIPAILLSVVIYCVLSALLARLLPGTDAAFWTACALTLPLAIWLHLAVPARNEPGHRSPLPVWVKFPLVLLVVSFLILVKPLLAGFVTMFPMVGVFGAYEARRSLWTIARQIPIFMIAAVPLLATIRLGQERLGQPVALALGWVVFLVMLGLVYRPQLSGIGSKQ